MAAPHNLLVNLAVHGDDGRPVLAALVGADYSSLAITPQDSYKAPNVVRDALRRFATWDAVHEIELADWRVVDLGDSGATDIGEGDDPVTDYDVSVAAIATHVQLAHEMGPPLVVGLGGDHSVSVPLVAAAALRAKRLGVIQLDVHHDVRAADPSPTNGSPFRQLIDGNVIAGSDLVQIGIHPYANSRPLSEYCDSQDVVRYFLEEVRSQGIAETATAALNYLHDCDHIYLSVDIDVLDRTFAPGTAAALPGGLTPDELTGLVDIICSDPRLIALDVVEFDPSRDHQNITAYNVVNVLMHAFSAVARRNATTE